MASATRKKLPINSIEAVDQAIDEWEMEEEVKTYRARVVVEFLFDVEATNIDDANDMALDSWSDNVGFAHPVSVEVYED